MTAGAASRVHFVGVGGATSKESRNQERKFDGLEYVSVIKRLFIKLSVPSQVIRGVRVKGRRKRKKGERE